MDTKKKTRIENARIENVGLYYDGHFNNLYVRCVLDGRGVGSANQHPHGENEEVRRDVRGEH